jgi:phosphoribosylaminoimidazolecarboxamide formyltransferase / IMP cyclohydrolase
MRALISVHDKSGLTEFARGLEELGFEIVASGGTSAFLGKQGVHVTRVEDVTNAPELLDGRVKTLHPRIHGGILARRDRADDLEALDEQEIEPFDLVCVNFYPFSSIVARHGARMEDAVEVIDIGGPSMLRAAAKNFAYVAAVCDPGQYGRVLAELTEHGGLSQETRHALAADAFAYSAVYEAAIARWFAEGEGLPKTLSLSFEKAQDLAYGENPHQQAAYYRELGARRPLLSHVEQLQGRSLSFNNLHDLSGALMLLREFTLPTCVIIKHANACGVAVAATIEEAYERGLAADPLSAFGMVGALNRPVSAELAARISAQFVDVLIAPDYERGALDAWKSKPAVRILADRERRSFPVEELDYKRVPGGLLVQHRDWDVDERDTMTVVAGSLAEQQWGDLLFAWRVAKHIWSNAIVIAKDLQTIGIGAGQQSRVDAVRLALEKAQKFDHDLAGSVLSSDAFFPFADGPEQAVARGVTAIIQPGGSKRDDEVIAAVERAGAAMVFTGRRHFRH